MSLIKRENGDNSLPPTTNRHNKLEGLVELADILSEQINIDEIIRLIAQKSATLLEAETALIMLLNPKTQNTIKTIFRDGRELDGEKFRLVQINVCGWVLNKKEPFLSADIKTDDRFAKKQFKDVPVKSVVSVPLKTEGNVIGCILLLNGETIPDFSNADLVLLTKLSAIASPYLRNLQQLQQYFEAPLSENALLTKYKSVGLLGKSLKYIELLQSIEAAARCDVRVLLEGQTGTGKELIARAIHNFSARGPKTFLAIDCGAIPENLIESELFGHVKGAFTGAAKDRKGVFEAASGGTLFMDEIGNLPFAMQSKLMRVLQEGEIRPLGSNAPRKIDVRVICATSSSLQDLVKEGKFRDDLYYRLHVYPIYIPSLQDRQEDISILADHFLRKFSVEQRKKAISFHESIIKFMQRRPWPGNIRELENFVERMTAIAMPDDSEITADRLPPDLQSEYKEIISTRGPDWQQSLGDNLEEYEAQLIRKALVESNWNQSQAAKLLQISESNIRFRMGKLGIRKPQEI